MDTPSVKAQRGQGSAEFLIAAVPLLLIGLGGIEAVHWHFARQGVSLALSRAAREAVARNADPVALDDAFFTALLPLHAAPTGQESRNRLQRHMQRRVRDTGLPAWRIVILSPSHATFQDFASRDPDLPQHFGVATLDNDLVGEQHRAKIARGWPQGRGPASGQTAIEANILTLRLTWLHEPLLPGVRQLLRQLAPADVRYGSVAMARAGYLPIQREISFVMQSHPVAWPMPSHGRVVRADHPNAADTAFDDIGIASGAQDGDSYPADAGNSGNSENAASNNGTGSNGPGADGSGGPSSGDGHLPRFGGQPRCTGLWCLEEAERGKRSAWSGFADESVSGGWTDDGGKNWLTTNPAENDLPGQRGDETSGRDDDAPSGAPEDAFDPDDCPGCCD